MSGHIATFSNTTSGHIVDAAAAGTLFSVPFWWGAVSWYGQFVLLVLGILVAGMRGIVLLRELRRKG